MAAPRWVEVLDDRPDSRITGRVRALVLAGYCLIVVLGAAAAVASPDVDGTRVVLVGAAAALAGGALAVLGPRRLLLPGAAVATLGAALAFQVAGNVGWFATALLAAWCAAVGSRRVGLSYLAGLVVLLAVEWVWLAPDTGWPPWMAGAAVSATAAYAGRRQAALTDALRAAQADLDVRVRAEERARIARELHDIVAHSLTVTLLHVEGARLSVEHDPADAARALAEAERLARQSLDEIRGAVGLLREAGGDAALAPLPGLEALPALVAGFRSAGSDVQLENDALEVPTTVGLALYRITQEALSNAGRHGGSGPISVQLTSEPGVVRLCVSNVLRAGDRERQGGLGLVSMRERAASLGGTVYAGPQAGRWLVRAELPVAATLPASPGQAAPEVLVP